MKKWLILSILSFIVPFVVFSAEIKIPNSQSPPGSELRVPIVVVGADSLAGAEVVVGYDLSLLQPVRTETTPLTADFIIATSMADAKIYISIASATGLADGNGPIIHIIFKVLKEAAPGDTAAITLDQARLYTVNTTPIAATTQSALFTVAEPAFVYPNIFTPNGDGYNDYAQFIIPQELTESAEVLVFHPSNKLICHLDLENSNGFKWDGKDENGHEMEPGVYVYLIKSNGENYSNGTITLMR